MKIILLCLEECKDFSAVHGNCRKFIRCVENIRIRFTCPQGTGWEASIKTCMPKELVASCKKDVQQRKLGN